MEKAKPYSRSALAGQKSQRTFEGQDLLQIAMPLGGLGAGSICLNGQGGLQDFSIRNKPATSGVPDGHGTTDAAFALLHIKGRTPVTKLLEGPMPVEKKYNLGTKGQGFREGGHEGLPRFRKAAFSGEYPFGTVRLTDPDVPLRVRVTGFNPFIPLDTINSGIPCAILEYSFENRSKQRVEYEFSYHLSHLAGGAGNGMGRSSRNEVIPGGVHLFNTEPEGSEHSASASLTVVGHRPVVKAMWFRGGWFDSISALWREVSTGAFKANKGEDGARNGGRNGGSILLQGSLGPGESAVYPIVITWHFPNCHYEARRVNVKTAAQGCCDEPTWRPFYASQWDNAAEVAAYVHGNYASLRSRTQGFHDALFKSTLPSYVIDAVSANLAILKSPTLLLQENGNAWAWEGCFVDSGCCAGTCTHVWNYAQALPHLYPQLERTFRETEFERSMDRRGHVTFRSSLPDGETEHQFHAASDGQLGGIMKVYREWQISGD
ncbi:MAG: GH116 family glycosyl-hydrolase, partial [bacterium]|nr:GH116 family glycosyl-hydrolase [bacterium]